MLEGVFPEFLTLFADPDRPVALALLQAFPTRARLHAASQAELGIFLRRQHCPRSRERARAIYQGLQAKGFQIAPPIVRAKARLAGTFVAQLQTLVLTMTVPLGHHQPRFPRAVSGSPRGLLTQTQILFLPGG